MRKKSVKLNDLSGRREVYLASFLSQRKGNILWGNMFLKDILRATIKIMRF